MKFRCFFLMASIAMFSSPSSAQDLTIHVNKKGKVGFVDKNGTEVVKCIYESAYPFSDGYAIVSKSGKSGIINEKGEVVLPLKYSSILPWSGNTYLVKSGKLQGLASKDGKIILPAKYSYISKPNCYGKALVAVGGKATSVGRKQYMQNAKLGIVDKNGNILVTPKFKSLYEFTKNMNGVAPYGGGLAMQGDLFYVTDTLKTDCSYLGFNKNYSTDKAGVMDGNGNEILKTGLYSQVMMPCDGMVRYYIIKNNETYCGYHNLSNGKKIEACRIKSKIQDITFITHGDFAGDMAPVNDGSWHFINKEGQTVRKDYKGIKFDNHGLWAALSVSGKWDVFDLQNKDIKELSDYDDINFPDTDGNDMIYVVKKDNHYGAINKSGNEAIPFIYDNATGVVHGFICVNKDGKWGVVSCVGSKIVPIEYDSILLPSERSTTDFWAKFNGKYYHFNSSAQKLSSVGYAAVSNFVKGIAHVRPADMTLENTEVNRAQMFVPNTVHKDIEQVDIEKSKDAFGILVNTNDQVVFSLPVSTLYIGDVFNNLSKQNFRNLNKSEEKDILLQVTKENRSYDLKSTLSEDEWNY